MKKFNEVYFRLFFESTGNISFTINGFKKFLDTAIKFKNGNIINEDKHLLIDIPSEFFNYCIENQGHKISFNKVKELMQTSKHYRNIKNNDNVSLLFKIFDFNDEFEIKDFIFKTFKITENESEIFLEDVKYFNDKCKHLDGFFNVYNNIGICIINANSCDVQATIYHELSHYIQLVGNIRTVKKFNVDKEKLEDNEKFKQLKALDITFQDLNYYFSSSEFVPHIDDLIVGLWNTFQEFYNTKNDIDPLLNFFIILNKEIKENDNFSSSKFLQQYSFANNGNIAPLIMYVASYYFNHKYQKITHIIKQSLKNKFYKL